MTRSKNLWTNESCWIVDKRNSLIAILRCAAIAVSRDHKLDQSDERERIENAGGFVMWAGKQINKKTIGL